MGTLEEQLKAAEDALFKAGRRVDLAEVGSLTAERAEVAQMKAQRRVDDLRAKLAAQGAVLTREQAEALRVLMDRVGRMPAVDLPDEVFCAFDDARVLGLHKVGGGVS